MAPKKQNEEDEVAAGGEDVEMIKEQADGQDTEEQDVKRRKLAAKEADDQPEEAVKEEQVVFQENEKDAPADTRKKLEGQVQFLLGDTTPNVAPATTGEKLLSLKEGALQYLLASARGNIGIKSGRYAFEVKILETLEPAEAPKAQGSRGLPKSILRLGFSTAGSSLTLGEGEESACYDENGGFMHNKKRTPAKVVYATGVSFVIVLNLESGSPNFNTMSLFKNGVRCGAPQALPDVLKGKTLFPTISFKNYTVQANFSSIPDSPLTFKCRMLEDAAAEDVVVTKGAPTDKPEVIFPVFLPDEGTYDWLDWYLSENPARFSELSDRFISDWCLKSGLHRTKTQSFKASNDKPDMNFGIRGIDDGNVKETLVSLAHSQNRSCIAMEVKGNLTKEDRVAAVKTWENAPHKKIAQVMIGIPEEAYRKRTHDMMLVEKQEKMNKDFEATKAKKREEKMRKKEELKKKAEGAEKETAKDEKTEEVKDEEKPEVKKEEDVSEDEKMEDDDGKPEIATLTTAEKQVRFRKPVTPDLSSTVMSASLDKFSLPGDDEGFDEVRYSWSPADQCEQFLKDWILERKNSTRIDDLNPSEWFKEKWGGWQKDLQLWHLKHVEFKDPQKRQAALAAAQTAAQSKAAGASFKAPPPQKPESKPEEKPDEEKKEKPEEDKKKEEDDDNKDPLQALEEEMDKEDVEIFGIEDICDLKDGQGTPLFSAFAFEDWALLSLRFELHLLVHAFRNDAGEPKRFGIHPEHLSFYYKTYYKKDLVPKNYGMETVDELVELVKDTVIQGMRSKVVESQITEDLESNEIFIKLTEEARRDRQRRIDAGDESANLKFSRPQQPTGGVMTKSAAPVPAMGSLTKAPPMMGEVPNAPMVVRPPAFAQRPNFPQRPQTPAWAANAGGFNKGGKGAFGFPNPGIAGGMQRPNMPAMQMPMTKASGGWNAGGKGNLGNWGGWGK